MLCKLGNGFFNVLIACHLLAFPVKACVPASVPVQVVQGNTPAIARGLDTVGKLAKELGLSRQAIYDARARFPNAPAKHEDGRRENLAAWQQFCAENVIGKDVATKNLSDLKAELMREQIRLARAKNQREAGEVIAAEVVDDMLVTLAQKLDLLLRLKLEVELGQRVIGKNAAEANVEGGLILDEIREVINSNIATYQGEMVARSADLSDA